MFDNDDNFDVFGVGCWAVAASASIEKRRKGDCRAFLCSLYSSFNLLLTQIMQQQYHVVQLGTR